MYTPEDRASLRSQLIDDAAADARISGAAITGSAAAGTEDEWSDIDLAFGVGDGGCVDLVLSDWTAKMYQRHGALHHVDVLFSPWIYRVFLLPNTLQVDLAFVGKEHFRPLSPAFQLVSGQAQEPQNGAAPRLDDLIGMAWLYALHARSCIARGKVWQAEYMISGMRDNALALTCARYGLSPVHAKGFDSLPSEVSDTFQGSLIRDLNRVELVRAFQVVTTRLVSEIQMVDEALARRLENALDEISREP